jgi:hypothetical protein
VGRQRQANWYACCVRSAVEGIATKPARLRHERFLKWGLGHPHERPAHRSLKMLLHVVEFFLVFLVFRYSIYLKINFVLTWRASLGELGEVLQLRLVVQFVLTVR